MPRANDSANRILANKPRTWAEIPALLAKAIQDCQEGREPWPLFLWGGPGVGKTCAALCLLDLCGGGYFNAAELCEQHNDAKAGRFWVDMPSQRWKPNAQSFRFLFLDRPPLLVLDELGSRQTVSDAAYEVVKFAVDARENRPFIAISNLELKKLQQVYDARIFSRLAAGSVVEVTGADRRLQ